MNLSLNRTYAIYNEYSHDSDIELGDKMTLLAGQMNAAHYRFLKMIGEFDRRGWFGGY